MKKLILPAFLALLLHVHAQVKEVKQYLYINAGGGMHSLSYNLQNGTRKDGSGYTVNAGYSHFFTPHWGVQTGLGLQSVSATALLNYMAGTPSVDADGDSYEFRTYYNNWKEKQRVLLFDIPLGLQYTHSLGKKLSVLATAGGKIDIPLTSDYKIKSGEIVTKGFYSQWNAEVSDNARHDFTTITHRPSGDLSLKTCCSLFADLGGLYPLSDKLDLYMGAYMGYGLSNLANRGSKMVYQQDGTYNGVLASNLIDRVRPVTFGVKVGLYLRLGHKKQAITPVTPECPESSLPVLKDKPAEVADNVPATEPSTVLPDKDSTNVNTITKKIDPYDRARAIVDSLIIRFRFNSIVYISLQSNRIDELSNILKSNPDISLLITGHTCNIGSRKVNYRLGKKRALTVKKLFLKHGIATHQIQTQSKAFDEPLVPNNTVKNRAKNRRVQLIVK